MQIAAIRKISKNDVEEVIQLVNLKDRIEMIRLKSILLV
jgi:hypothetical protein